MKVHFTDATEFLRELELEKDQVEDKIVRLTPLYTATSIAPMAYVHLVCTCMVRGKLLELKYFAGESWGPGMTETGKTHQRASNEKQRITEAAKLLGLDVRAGVFEE